MVQIPRMKTCGPKETLTDERISTLHSTYEQTVEVLNERREQMDVNTVTLLIKNLEDTIRWGLRPVATVKFNTSPRARNGDLPIYPQFTVKVKLGEPPVRCGERRAHVLLTRPLGPACVFGLSRLMRLRRELLVLRRKVVLQRLEEETRAQKRAEQEFEVARILKRCLNVLDSEGGWGLKALKIGAIALEELEDVHPTLREVRRSVGATFLKSLQEVRVKEMRSETERCQNDQPTDMNERGRNRQNAQTGR